MKIDLLNTFSWEETNDLLTSRWPDDLKSSQCSLRVQAGLAQAVFEIGFGTGLLFSHKRQVAILSGDTWAFEGLLPHLYKESYTVTLQPRQSLVSAQEFVGGLHKDTLFVLWAEDHPILGSYFSLDELDKALNAKKIYSIRVSHSAFLYRKVEIRPYSIRICSINPAVTVCICGTRFRAPPVTVHRMAWTTEHVVQTVLAKLTNHSGENEKVVLNFESEISKLTGFKSASVEPRLYDRAVIYNPEINAEPVMAEILTRLEKSPQQQSEEAEVINSCRWQPVPQFKTWWNPPPSNEVIRGLLILGLRALSDPDILKWVQEGEKNSRFNLG